LTRRAFSSCSLWSAICSSFSLRLRVSYSINSSPSRGTRCQYYITNNIVEWRKLD
jgi:hypothetical protein